MPVTKKITETIDNKKTKPKIGYINTTKAATTHRMPVPSVNSIDRFYFSYRQLFLMHLWPKAQGQGSVHITW